MKILQIHGVTVSRVTRYVQYNDASGGDDAVDPCSPMRFLHFHVRVTVGANVCHFTGNEDDLMGSERDRIREYL